MIKGVNKYVVEIIDTGNPVFEKIVCYVNAEYAGAGSAALKRNAGETVNNLTETECIKRVKSKKKRRLPGWMVSIGSAAIGAGICFLMK